MTTVNMICHCGMPYAARQADLDRGWGLSCDKHCAAIRRDFGRKAAKRADGRPIKRTNKKGARRCALDNRLVEAERERMHQAALDADEQGWDAHKNY